MKLRYLFILILLGFQAKLKAQYVTIPDSTFVVFLTTDYPNCMVGNQMDTTCLDIVNENSLSIAGQNFANLEGLQYFTNLTYLSVWLTKVTSIPDFAPNIVAIDIYHNDSLLNLPPLPNSLQTIWCDLNNSITSLPNLPNNLIELSCIGNSLDSLPALPSTLEILNCNGNSLSNLPILPSNLQNLNCENNFLTSLPALNSNLEYLFCNHNFLDSLPSLPSSLKKLWCANNNLNQLPSLPPILTDLFCEFNNLTGLPTLNAYLYYLICDHNFITSLPNLPNDIGSINCGNNALTSLPNLPISLTYLACDSNNIPCFPVFPNSIIEPYYLSIENNPFTCLPNYVPAMDTSLLNYPICINGDSINNLNNCTSTNGVWGFTYIDMNTNCTQENSDQSLQNIAMKLTDTNGNFIAETSSIINGIYNFDLGPGNYTVNLDTVGKPYTVNCSAQGLDSTFTLTTQDPSIAYVNFDIECKPGFDIGVQSVVTDGWVFPGQVHQLNVLAGNFSNWYNLNCAANLSGTVQVTVNGNITYLNTAPGALMPIISGNTFTYNISNFDSIDYQNAFGLLLSTDTTAQSNDTICVNVTVNPILGDNNQGNNSLDFCYNVINSYDPNYKEVYPVNVNPGFQDWFTYTIHFQNIGTAPAFNIKLIDTLDSNLNLNTFEVINYSHPNITSINQNTLTVRFNNIFLPDSLSDPFGSRGFIQYRVKPNTNLIAGSQIQNNASIYFDYNPPIVTNTTINSFLFPVGQTSPEANEFEKIILFPNPSRGLFTLQADNLNEASVTIYNLIGQIVLQEKNVNSNTLKLDLSIQPKGLYIVEVAQKSISKRFKIAKQ